jgi:purine-binding chemotaxis protein CheW
MMSTFLLCRVGTLLCALPVDRVVETMRPVPLDALAGAPPCVLGVAIIRGIPVPVVDAARLINEEATDAGRFVLLRAGHRHLALAVHEVVGVRAISAASVETLPGLLGDATADFVTAIGTLDAQVLLVLESMRILPESLRDATDTVGVGQ